MLNCDSNCDSLLLHSSTLFHNQFRVTLVIMSFSQSGDVQQFLKNDQTCTFVSIVYFSNLRRPLDLNLQMGWGPWMIILTVGCPTDEVTPALVIMAAITSPDVTGLTLRAASSTHLVTFMKINNVSNSEIS